LTALINDRLFDELDAPVLVWLSDILPTMALRATDDCAARVLSGRKVKIEMGVERVCYYQISTRRYKGRESYYSVCRQVIMQYVKKTAITIDFDPSLGNCRHHAVIQDSTSGDRFQGGFQPTIQVEAFRGNCSPSESWEAAESK